MGTTPITSTAFLQGLQKGGKGFTSLRAKADVRELAKTDPRAKRLLYGGQLTQREMVRYGKKLQEMDQHAFTQRSVRTVYSALARSAATKERLEHASVQNEQGAILQRQRDRESREKAAYVRAKELEAEGKRAALKDRPTAVVSAGQTSSMAEQGSAAPTAEPPPTLDMPID